MDALVPWLSSGPARHLFQQLHGAARALPPTPPLGSRLVRSTGRDLHGARPSISRRVRCSGTQNGTEDSTPAKGFGSTAGGGGRSARKGTRKGDKRAVTGGGESPQIKRLLRQVETLEGGVSGREEEGRVDFVQVESWDAGTGSSAPEDLEALRLRSFSPSFSAGPSTDSLYEQIVRRVQLLDSQGEVRVAQERPLPPFERWKFSEKRYHQYLVDQLVVHEALEEAVSRNCQDGQLVEGPAQALGEFVESAGLQRSKALRSDIAALEKALEGEQRPATSAHPQSGAYARYLSQLSRQGESLDPATAERGRCSLLAHIFCIYVAFFTTGMRVGARAVSSLPGLRAARAVAFYRDFPEHARDPFKQFVASIDAAGTKLGSPEMLEQVMAELPSALQKTSLLLAVLAVEE